MTKRIRFWHYNNGAVLITLHEGQTLHHSQSWATDEGWSSDHNEWHFDGTRVTHQFLSDGVDCDGRLARYSASQFLAADARAGFVDEDGIAFPNWQHLKSSQRDYSAEAMGY